MNTHIHKKKFGQNFLVDPDVIIKIIDAVNPKDNELFVEIGPGSGILTKNLVPKVKQLTAIEIDKSLIEPLSQILHKYDSFQILNQDILQTNLSDIYSNDFRVIGNLPYNISTPILFHCINNRAKITDCFFMLQKEVVDRIIAKPDSKAYGRLTISMQYFAEVEKLFDVEPACFSPIPKVTSSFLHLKFREFPGIKAKDEHLFLDIVKQAFMYRRKQLHNSLKGLVDIQNLHHCQINAAARPENLSINDFICLSNNIVTTNNK